MSDEQRTDYIIDGKTVYYEGYDPELIKIDTEDATLPIYTAVMAATEAASNINYLNKKVYDTAMPVNKFLSNLSRQISGKVRSSISQKDEEQITGAAFSFETIAGSTDHTAEGAKKCYELYKEHIDNYLTSEELYVDTTLVETEEQALSQDVQVATDDSGAPIKGYVDDDGSPVSSDSGDYIIKPLGYLVEPYISEDNQELLGLLIAWGRTNIVDSEDVNVIVKVGVTKEQAMEDLKKKYPGVYSIKLHQEDAADLTKDVLESKAIINGYDPTIKNIYQAITRQIQTYAARGKTAGAFSWADLAPGLQSQSEMQQQFHAYDDANGGNAIITELQDKGYLVKTYQSQYAPYDELGLKIAWGANDAETNDLEENYIITPEEAMAALDTTTPNHGVDTQTLKNIVAPRAEDLIETAFAGTEQLSKTVNNLIGETIQETVVQLKNNIISQNINYVIIDTTNSTNAALKAFILGKNKYNIKHRALTLYADETYIEQSHDTYEIGTPIDLPQIMDDLGYLAYLDGEPIYLDSAQNYILFGYYDLEPIKQKIKEAYLLEHPEATEAQAQTYVDSLSEEKLKEEFEATFKEEVLQPLRDEIARAEANNATSYYEDSTGRTVTTINAAQYSEGGYTDKIEDYGESDRLTYWKNFFAYVNKKVKSTLASKHRKIKRKKITTGNSIYTLKIPFAYIRGGNDSIAGVRDVMVQPNTLSNDLQFNTSSSSWRYSGIDGISIIQVLYDLGWNLIWRPGQCQYKDLISSRGQPVWDTFFGANDYSSEDKTSSASPEYASAKDWYDTNIDDLWKLYKSKYASMNIDQFNDETKKSLSNAELLEMFQNELARIKAVSTEKIIDSTVMESTDEKDFKYVSGGYEHAPLYDVKYAGNPESGHDFFYADPHPMYGFYWASKKKQQDLKPAAYGTSYANAHNTEMTAAQKKKADKYYYLHKDMGANIFGVIDPNEDPVNASAAISYSDSVISNKDEKSKTAATQYVVGRESETLKRNYVTIPWDDISSAAGIIVVFSDYTSFGYPTEELLRAKMETNGDDQFVDGITTEGTYLRQAYYRRKKKPKVLVSDNNPMYVEFEALKNQIAAAEGVKNPKKQ